MKKQQKITKTTLTAQVFSSINAVPRHIWNELANQESVSASYEFWHIIENSNLNDFKYKHAIFFDNKNTPVALASYYSITTDIAIFAPVPLRNVLTIIRRIFPNFLKMRILECGTPITVSSPPFLIKESFLETDDLITALSNLLLNEARADGHFLVVVRDFEQNAKNLHSDFKKLGYHWVNSLPNTYMNIPWHTSDEYAQSMKSYYRSKLIKHLNKNDDAKIHYELVDDFSELADTLCSQWLIVHHNADEFQREVLTPSFYHQLSQGMRGQAKVILAYQEHKLIGHALLLVDNDQLRWLYFGRTSAVNDSLYIYIAHKVIECAIVLGAKKLEMGLTTYSIKRDLGGQMTPICLAIQSPYKLINPMIGFFYRLLNRTPPISNKTIFKMNT